MLKRHLNKQLKKKRDFPELLLFLRSVKWSRETTQKDAKS